MVCLVQRETVGLFTVETGVRSSGSRLRIGCLACVTALGAPAWAQSAGKADVITAPTVSVTADKPEIAAPGTVPDVAGTVYDMGPDMIERTAVGGSNPMRAVSLLPGVDSPAIDPFGMANIPGSNKGLRIRGELNMHGNTIGTVEGVPTMGVDPGPGYQFLIDNENLASVTVYQGPIAPGRLAFFTTSGVVDSLLRWPEQRPGFEVSQSFGEYGFLRSAMRADSGILGDNSVRLFASASWTDADRWRGTGKAPGGRNGEAFGLVAEPLSGLTTKLFFSYSDMRQETYRGLTYAQISDLEANRFLDFNTTSSASAAQAILYQGYNRQDFTDWMVLGELRYQVSDSTVLIVKPYYFHENGAYLDGMPNGKVRNWLIDHDAYGLTAEAAAELFGGQFTLGYWWSSLEPPGPPTAWKIYNPNADGSMSFAMWAILSKTTGRHVFNSTYASAARDFGPLRIELGARYIWESIPGITQYNAAGVGDVSYEAALAASSGAVASRSVTGYTKEAFLPYGVVSAKLAPDLTVKLSAGRNYGAPGFEVWPVFQANAAAFLAKGIVADDLWQTIRPETSIVTDLSFRWDFASSYGTGYLEPVFYYANYQNKSVSYDSGAGIAYNRNVGMTHAHGVQVSAHYAPVEAIEMFVSLAYARNRFSADLPTLGTATASTVAAVAVKDKSVPDAPEWAGALGAVLQMGDFSFSPVVHYVGSRYGDSLNTQLVPDYVVFDINATYSFAVTYGQIDLSLSVDNLFDRNYVGFINSGYYQASSASGGIYFPGAPRTVWGKISFKG